MNDNLQPNIIDQKTLHTIINLIEHVVEKSKSDPKTLCNAGKSYLALVNIHFNHLCDQTLYFFKQAAQLGYGLAYHYLGHLYQNAIGVEKDLHQALNYYEKAAESGYFLSLHRIGYFYHEGICVPKDLKKAVYHYEKVITASLAAKRTASSLGFCKTNQPVTATFTKQTSLLPPEYKDTIIGNLVANLTTKIENGLISSLTNLALLYLEREEFAHEKLKGYDYLNQAAKLGSPFALTFLADLHYQGIGVKQDHFRAAKLYEQAAEQNHAPAQVCIGHFYQNSIGVQQDLAKAKKYYELAALSGNAHAYVHLGYCHQTGTGTDIDYEKAFYYYQLAVDQNHPVGFKNLAVLYYEGLGVKQDRDKAKLLLDQAKLLSA